MKKIIFLCIALVVLAFSANANHLTDRLTLSARLQGQNQVPAVTTTANGVASFMLSANRDTMYVNVAMTGLKATAIHIHDGKAGTNGGVFKDLTEYLEGNVVRTIITGADLSPANLKKFLSGGFYVNVHTAANPNGEIRGQIIVEEDKGYYSLLNGAQEVPAVTTAANGYGVYSVDKSGQRIQFKVVVEGASGAIGGAHFHIGKSGTNGGVVVDLSSFISGNVMQGYVDVPATFAADAAAGNIYINLHTAANPNGEIRGQLTANKGLQFDAMMDNAQHVGGTPVASAAQGVAYMSLNYTLDTLTYYITAKNLTGATTSAHIHDGAVGVNGGVIFDFGAVTGNVISGQITGTKLTTDVINHLLSGGYYINMHTPSNPNGEIRGQIYRLAREGYILELSGSQLNPASGSKAKGGGLVTVDRGQTNAHYMMAVDGLSGAPTAAHFHKALKGVNGGVIYELPTTTGSYGYWSQSSMPVFTTGASRAFRGDSVYVAFHTAANPNGEVRGQLVRNYKISGQTTMVPSSDAPFGIMSNRLTLSARLQGQNEVPAVTTTANGVGSFMLNATRDTMQINVAMTGFKATAIHIHDGKAGTNGGVFKDLTGNLAGNVVRTMLTGADLSPANLKKFLSGGFYINVHSAANPNGEIRGQIIIEEDKGYFADINGAQEVPAVTTTANASGIFSVDKSGQRIQFKIVAQNMSGAIGGAHLHIGKAGANGGVTVDLSSFIFGNTIIGSTDVPASLAADAASQSIYVNIHTAANPNGEIRGQLTPYAGLQFDAKLDNEQLGNNAVISQGQGVARLGLNYAMDTLSYSIFTTNLSSPIAASHIHLGAPGTNGGVEFDLGAGTGNVITGQITGKANLTTAAINKLLRGEYYINVHTANNPMTGEIRGQVSRLAREGYVAEVGSDQLVPAGTSKAQGGGIVTIDRNQTNAHYMIAVDGLTGAPTAAHFHKAVKGTNGGVIYELPTTTGMYGYWSQVGTNKFVAANEKSFRGDSVYVAFHTAANPNGEVRGQFARNYKISKGTISGTSEAHSELVNSSKLYPNPVTNTLNLELNTVQAINAKIIICDALGKTVSVQNTTFEAGDNQTSISVNDLTNGLYFLQIQGENQTILVRKFIKE